MISYLYNYYNQQVMFHPTTQDMDMEWQASDFLMEVDLEEYEEDMMEVDSKE